MWEISGGSNFWREFKNEYESDWTIQTVGGTKQEILSITLDQQGASTAHIKVSCRLPANTANMKESFEYKINLLQRGTLSRHLLNPREHRHSITVACEPPASERILWSQRPSFNPKVRSLLARSRFVENTRTHYVLTNTKHFVRYLMLDSQGFAFINHTSIETVVSAQPSDLASVLALDQAYDKRMVSFNFGTGTVYLNVRSTGYQFHSLPGKKGGLFGGSSISTSELFIREIRDQMKIEVVNPVQVEPRYKSIYFMGPRNT